MNALRNIVVESKNYELHKLVGPTHTMLEIETGVIPIFDLTCTSPTHYADFIFNDMKNTKIVSIYYDENSVSVELSRIIEMYRKSGPFGSRLLILDFDKRYPPCGFEELKQNIYDLIEIHNALDLREYRIVSVLSDKI